MPNILIEVRKAYTAQQESQIIDAVHDALVAAFKTRPQDKNVRLVVHDPRRFSCSDMRENPECFTHITIDCMKGRSLEAKRKLYRLIIEKMKPFGIPPNEVEIIIREFDKENFGIRGGYPASDLDLGYMIEV